MTVIELMDLKVSSFSKTDRRIYEQIKKFPHQFAYNSISEITEKGNLSKAALSRFAKKLGFSGYMEFQYQFCQELKENSISKNKVNNADVYSGLLHEVVKTVTPEDLAFIAEKIRNSRRVIIFGTNLSRMAAEVLNISLQFETNVISSLSQNDVPPVHFDSRDLYIFFSAIAGSSHQNLLKELNRNDSGKPYLILITTNSKHPLRHHFDSVFALPSVSLAAGSSIVFSDSFAFMMFNDLLVSYMKNTERGISETPEKENTADMK